MTVPATNRRAGPFNGNGATTSFPFTFKVFAATDIAVLAVRSGVQSTLVLATDYTVTLHPDQDANPGGTVITIGAPLATGDTLAVVGALPYDQTLDLPAGGAFRPLSLENALDRAVIQIQQLAEESDRSLKLPATSTANATLPAPDASKIIGWNDTATGLVNRDITDLASVIAYGANTTEFFSGTGAQTTFALAADPGSVHNLDVSIGGVVQSAGADFTLSGTTLTFISAPPAGTSNIAVRSGQALPVGVVEWVDVRNKPFADVRDYGAVGDGATDDTAAIQTALDSGRWVFLPRGTYLVSSELVIKKNSGLIGEASDFWQFSANQPSVPASATTIKYVGPGGANSCVVRASAEAVGVLPAFALGETTNLSNVCIRSITIDGNNLAEFGLYVVRVMLGSIIDRITVTGTKKRGFFFGELFTNQVGPLLALMNYGTGGSIGEDLFSWSTGNIVNATEWDTLVAFKNGRDGLYDESSAPKECVGWIINFNRANTINNLVVELNYGAGAYVSPRAGPNKIGSVYLEDNCHFDPAADQASSAVSAFVDGAATQPWGLVGYNRGGFLIAFDTVFGASGGTSPVRYQHIWLTGDTSGGFVTEPIEPWTFAGVFGVRTLTSDFYNYGVTLAQQALTNATGGSGQADLDRCLPYYGDPESLVGAATTLYVGNTASGNKSGRDSSNRMLFVDAMECARVCSGVTTLDVSAMASASSPTNALSCIGRGFTRPLTLAGGTTARFVFSAAENVALFVQDWVTQLTIRDMLSLDRVSMLNSEVEIDDCPVVRTGANSSGLAALVVDRSSLEINGTTVVNVSTSTATTKIPLAVQGNSEVSFNNAAAGTVGGFTAGNAIHFNEGSGVVRVSLTTATATWAAAASVARNAGGGAGMVLAPNGLNP